jgi:hypothetical protein
METKAELQAMGFELTPVLRAIRAKCLDCSGGSHAEVAECLVKKCALYPFRLGGPSPIVEPELVRHLQRSVVSELESLPANKFNALIEF